MIQDIALKLFKRVPQIARKSVATTLPSVEAGLKSTKLNGDVLNLTQESKLISLAENVLGRKLELKSLTSMLDKEHVLGEGWHGTINCLNDKIRMGYPLDIIGDLVTKVDDVILSGKKTIADSIAYRGESYSIKNKHLQNILNLKPGDKIQNSTYTFITGDQEWAKHFSGNNDVSVMYNFVMPKNSSCILCGDKDCYLAARNSTLEILNINKSDPSKIIIDAILRTN